MAQFQYAFVCGSFKGIELQKYRDCAYAGCAPFGDLPGALSDCPRDAFFAFDGTMLSSIRAVYGGADPQQVAIRFREFMRTKRNPSALVSTFDQQLSELLQT